MRCAQRTRATGMDRHADPTQSGAPITVGSGGLSARFAAAHLDWIVPEWAAPASVHAFFTTRTGGSSTGGCAPFDLASAGRRDRGSSDDALVENHRRVQSFLPSTPLWLEQVHGTGVIDADSLPQTSADRPPRADAALTRATGVVLAVRVADCLPALFCDRAASVVAAAHAGWRGLVAGVLENTIAAMRCAPADIVVWLGPAIGARAFEVGGEVRDAFAAVEPSDADAFVPGGNGKWHGDLAGLARQRLLRAGVTNVAIDGHCTWSEPQRFFSFRRDRTSARMAAFVWRTDR
jgi:YfiH family protein